jgi:hypothetical protein
MEALEGKMGSPLAAVIGEELGLGDHVAYFFKSNAERLGFAIPYIVRGLKIVNAAFISPTKIP